MVLLMSFKSHQRTALERRKERKRKPLRGAYSGQILWDPYSFHFVCPVVLHLSHRGRKQKHGEVGTPLMGPAGSHLQSPCQIKTFATLPPSLRKGQLQARFMLWISALNCGCLNVPVLLSSNSSRNQHKGSNFLLTKLILTLSRISLRETDFCQVSSRIHRERINWLLHHALCWKMKK